MVKKKDNIDKSEQPLSLWQVFKNLLRRLENQWTSYSLLEKLIWISSGTIGVLGIADLWDKFVKVKGYLKQAVELYHDYQITMILALGVEPTPFVIMNVKLICLYLSTQVLTFNAIKSTLSREKRNTESIFSRDNKKVNILFGIVFGYIFWLCLAQFFYQEYIPSIQEFLESTPWYIKLFVYFGLIYISIGIIDSERLFLSLFFGNVAILYFIMIIISIVSEKIG
ncbi:hypothetical protein [Vibrio sp. FJH11]